MTLTCYQERVVAALPQFHHDVEEAGDARAGCSLRQEGEVLLQNGAIVLLLDDSQLHLHIQCTHAC